MALQLKYSSILMTCNILFSAFFLNKQKQQLIVISYENCETVQDLFRSRIIFDEWKRIQAFAEFENKKVQMLKVLCICDDDATTKIPLSAHFQLMISWCGIINTEWECKMYLNENRFNIIYHFD